MQSEKKEQADEIIFSLVRPFLDEADMVLTYVSTDIEVDTRRIIQYCFENNIKVATPVSGENELYFYPVASFSELAEGRFGILEPVAREHEAVCSGDTLCIVPALCADGSGARLGYGRGYYDRFLSDFQGRSVILCYSDFRMDVPAEEHDVKADITVFDDQYLYTKRR